MPMTTSTYYSSAVALAVGTVLFLILGIGALGIIGDGGRPDRLYASGMYAALFAASAWLFKRADEPQRTSA